MAADASSDRNATAKAVLVQEIGPDGIARESPVIAYTEKIIEEKQLQLRKYIDENYSKIRDVEKELANLTMETKLTAGPKKAAFEHMRKKIEMSTEKIHVAKLKEEQARKVRESSNTQLARLEELKRKLEALNPSRASTSSAVDLNSVGPAPSSMTQDVSLVQGTQESPNGSSEITLREGNAAAEKGQNQQPEARGKKKINTHGSGKGIGIIPKSRGSAPPGWTGAGFDLDGRS
ncbi:unnamed protein product [Withania somnifera]